MMMRLLLASHKNSLHKKEPLGPLGLPCVLWAPINGKGQQKEKGWLYVYLRR
jgi:hypothetical protein